MIWLIAGVAGEDGGEVEERLLDAMLDAMNPLRRPSARRVARAPGIGVGVLAVAPEGAGTAPEPPAILPVAGGLFAADARLYGEPGGTLEGGVAAERLAEAVLAGPAALGTLHGDFAYAFWESSGRGLELGRDQFGVRPLVYAAAPGGRVAFASHPAALFGPGLAGRELDLPAMIHILRDYYPHADHTAFAGVRMVPAAHVVRVARGRGPEVRRYWRLPLPPRLSFDADEGELAREIRRRLERAVRRRLPAAGPGAGELSGGLDSSPIAVLGARALAPEGRPFVGYGLAEDQERWGLPALDEFATVREIAAAEPNLEAVPVTTPGYWALLRAGHDPDTFLRRSPEDPVNALLADASRRGARAMFTGFPGDQLVTHRGRGALAELFWLGRWRRLARLLRDYSSVRGGSVWAHLRWRVFIQSLPLGARRWLLRPFGRTDSANRWVRRPPPFLRPEWHGLLPVEPIHDGWDTRRNRRSEIGEWLVEHRFASHAWQAAPHGLRYVAPMVDRDLVAFSLSIPGLFYARPGAERTVFREAIRDLVPPSVHARPDKSYPFPLESWRLARARPEIMAWLDSLREVPLVTAFIDLDALQAHLATLPDAETVRREAQEAYAAGTQPVFHDGEYESTLRFLAILAEHAELFSLPRPHPRAEGGESAWRRAEAA